MSEARSCRQSRSAWFTEMTAAPTTAHAVKIDRLVVRYPEFQLGPVTLDVPQGQVLAVVGPNGSGKTTMLRALCGLRAFDEGFITLAGGEVEGRPDHLLANAGYIPDDHTELLPELTARELWDLHVLAHQRRGRDPHALRVRGDQIAARFNFDPPNEPIGSYSHGMTKKVQLVAALMHDPKVVVLDEPQNGLDPAGIEELDAFIRDLAERGAGVIVSSHDLYYAERVADRILMLSKGQMLAYGTTPDVVGDHKSLRDSFFARLAAVA